MQQITAVERVPSDQDRDRGARGEQQHRGAVGRLSREVPNPIEGGEPSCPTGQLQNLREHSDDQCPEGKPPGQETRLRSHPDEQGTEPHHGECRGQESGTRGQVVTQRRRISRSPPLTQPERGG